MRLLDAMGKRWSLRVMWELREQPLTFRQLQARCNDVSPTSLNSRLKELRELGLVEATEDGYAHTKWGAELGSQLLALNKLAERWDKEATGR